MSSIPRSRAIQVQSITMPLPNNSLTLDQSVIPLILEACEQILPELRIEGGAPEPFYQAPKASQPAILFFREDFVRSLFHELAHYCLAGPARRQLDDFGYWYSPCGRSVDQQLSFEQVEARPQGLEKLLCEIWSIPFSPSLDDFSGRPPSDTFIENLENGYIEMVNNPPETPQLVLEGMRHFISTHPTACSLFDRMSGTHSFPESRPRRSRSNRCDSLSADRATR